MYIQLPYKDIAQVMPYIRIQIRDSVPYARKHFSGFDSAADLYRELKRITQFEYDPDDMELLQESKTLFEDNWHGIPGAGDCDCFTITAIAALLINGFDPYIILAGNGRSQPSHIYAGFLGRDNVVVPFDLTEKYCGQRRTYKYYQLIHVTK